MVVSNALAMTLAPAGLGSSPRTSDWPRWHVISSSVHALSTEMGIFPHVDSTIVVRSVDWKAVCTSATCAPAALYVLARRSLRCTRVDTIWIAATRPLPPATHDTLRQQVLPASQAGTKTLGTFSKGGLSVDHEQCAACDFDGAAYGPGLLLNAIRDLGLQ